MKVEFDPVLVHEWLRRSAGRTPDKAAIICGNDRWSYKRLDLCSDRFAEALVELGLQRQDRVVILTGNCPETVVSLYGTLKAGGVFVVLDANTKARRLRYVLDNCRAKVLIARTEQMSVVAEGLTGWTGEMQVLRLGEQTGTARDGNSPGSAWATIMRPDPDAPACRPSIDKLPRCIDIDLAALIYTSATTGDPKGVMSTHHNMISAARSIIQYLGNRSDDVICTALPLSFGYGLYQVLMSSMFGGTVLLESSFLYPHLILKRIAEGGATGLPLVPSMVAVMMRMDLSAYDLHTLRYITSASAALPVHHMRSLRRWVPQAELYNMYGLTECARVCYLMGEELDHRPTSVGQPMPNCDVLVVDEAGREVQPGNTGELIIRGSNVMQGYWGDPEMTATAYRPGPYPAWRWLHSGDHFRRDEEGYLSYMGRKDDMIKSGGERISPREVEDALYELDNVAEAAVVGVPDEILGQVVKAFVVAAPPGELDEKAIRRHCVRRLSPFMVPKYVELVASLPKTMHGKIHRDALLKGEGQR